MKNLTKDDLKEITYEIIGAAIYVHQSLGPGLLESIYHECMKIELRNRGMAFETEMAVPVYFCNQQLETRLRCDLFVENAIVVELKSVADFAPIHAAQVMTYMKLLEAPKGILINFNCFNLFRDGQKTFVNEHYRLLAEN